MMLFTKLCRRNSSLAAVTTVLLLLTTAVSASSEPTVAVKLTVDAVLTVLRNPGITKSEQKEQVATLIHARFNFPEMAKSILATNWKNASADQQTQFVELFRQLLTNTYWKSISLYSDETIEFVGEKVKDGTLARVNTVIVTAANEIPVDYSLKVNDGEWLAYDVVIEGISLVRNFRGSYQQIIKNEGMDGLLTRLREKVSQPDV